MARHYDEYGTEIYWLNYNGKCKKYSHETDNENGNIVKAYNHWHSNLNSIWDGHFDKDEIQRLSERFGFYDENGKKIKGGIENYSTIVTSTESFLNKNIQAAYASHEFEYHIPVLQSYAAIIISKSDFSPPDKNLKFERTFIVKDAFDSDVIGFVWSFVFNELKTYIIITWHGDLATRANIVVDHYSLTIDEIIYINIFHKYIKKEVISDKKWVYDGLEQILYPPCLDYISEYDNKDLQEYAKQNIVMNFSNALLSKSVNGIYTFWGNIEIHDENFTKEIDALGEEKYLTKENAKIHNHGLAKEPLIFSDLQVQFSDTSKVSKVLKVEVFRGDNFKSMYKRFDPVNEVFQIP